jgi:hypothetical protein
MPEGQRIDYLQRQKDIPVAAVEDRVSVSIAVYEEKENALDYRGCSFDSLAARIDQRIRDKRFHPCLARGRHHCRVDQGYSRAKTFLTENRKKGIERGELTGE